MESVTDQIGQRVAEIIAWILVRNAGWFGLLCLAVWICLQAIRSGKSGKIGMWIMAGFVCLSWGLFETGVGYYIHINGAQAFRLEQRLPDPELGHEHQRRHEPSWAKVAAGAAFAAPFIMLMLGICGVLYFGYQEQYGRTWAAAMIVMSLVSGIFYAKVMGAAMSPH